MHLNAELYVKDLPGQLVGSLEPISMVDGNIIGVVHDREKIVNQRILVSVTFEVANSKKLDELKSIWKSRDIFIRESFKMKSVAFRMWLTELFRTQFKLKDYENSIRENHLPVFLISGKEDYFFVNSVKKTHKEMRESSLCFIEKCGHVCSIEKYELFNDLVVKFLNSLSVRAAGSSV